VNKQTEPGDVLQVLADYSAQHGDTEDFEQARAAIAELIGRAQELSDSITFRIDDPRCELHCKLADAIARVGGGK
jgi:hypothetical protein